MKASTSAALFWRDATSVTAQHLDKLVQLLADASKREELSWTTGGIAVHLAAHVVRFYMGDQWSDRNLYKEQIGDGIATARGFFESDGLSGSLDARFRYCTKVVQFGESLYNLQSVPGISHRIKIMQSDDLEAGLGELRCARLVADPQLKLRFIVPIANAPKGSCYEAEFTTTANRTVYCEIKTKRKDTLLTEKTITETVQHARQQLPKGAPGVVFLQTPEPWRKSANFESVIESAVARPFRQSQRLVAVVFNWEEWVFGGSEADREVGRRYYYEGKIAFFNKKSPFYTDDIPQSLGYTYGRVQCPSWVNLYDYTQDCLSRAGVP